MATIRWQDSSLEAAQGETVLDTLLRAGVAMPFSCRAGACQSCMLRATAGQPPSDAQQGLRPALVESGCFLACMARPSGDLTVESPGAGARTPVEIHDIEPLSPSVLRLRLKAYEPHSHRAGQYLTLFRDAALARSYSICSLPEDPYLELHVRVIPGGRMSQWLASGVPSGTPLEIQYPAGNCFYTPDNPDQPLLLAATGTGLSPVYGILRNALASGHRAPIWLYHGALNAEGLYLVRELEALAAADPCFHYRPSLLNADGPLPDVVLANHPDPRPFRAFLCGDPGIVNQLRRRLFLAGMSSREILSDAFLPTT